MGLNVSVLSHVSFCEASTCHGEKIPWINSAVHQVTGTLFKRNELEGRRV